MILENHRAEFFKIAGEVGAFLQQVEKKQRGSVIITIDGEFGAGKTTMLYKFMDAFAVEGNKSVFFSLEEGANNYLIAKKRDEYLSEKAQNNISMVGEVENLQQFYDCIEPFDVVFIDSWQKVLEIEGAKNLKIDKELRQKFHSKVFVIIFQQNKAKQTKGKSEVLFDGDIVIKMRKGEKFTDNYAYFLKNRYTLAPIEVLAFNIAGGYLFNPLEEEDDPVVVEEVY